MSLTVTQSTVQMHRRTIRFIGVQYTVTALNSPLQGHTSSSQECSKYNPFLPIAYAEKDKKVLPVLPQTDCASAFVVDL